MKFVNIQKFPKKFIKINLFLGRKFSNSTMKFFRAGKAFLSGFFEHLVAGSIRFN